MIIRADGFEFDFPEALDAFVFDEKDRSQPHYHGLSHAMKAVDLVVELPTHTLFVEMKDFHIPDDYDFRNAGTGSDGQDRRSHFNHLQKVLIDKVRASWLYRWAEQTREMPEKPVKYLCVLTLDTPVLSPLAKELRQKIPVGRAGPRWQRPLVEACIVLNPERWNHVFPAWRLTRY